MKTWYGVTLGVVVCMQAAATLSCASRGESPRPASDATAATRPAGWDALCNADPATAPSTLRVADDVMFEPSGLAIHQGRLLVVADKQAYAWWWVPGTDTAMRDPAWEFTGLPAPGADSCCAAQPGNWGTELKRQKAAETCGDHAAPPGTAVPWLKLEAATTTPTGPHVIGNMGFGCRENSHVLRLPGPGMPPQVVPGVDRDAVLKALSATDVRIEGVAFAPDGSWLVGVRQKEDAQGDRMVRDVVRVQGDVVTVESFDPPADSEVATTVMSLSDLGFTDDGRVLLTISHESDVDGRRVVKGEAWVSIRPQPWSSGPGAWKMKRLAHWPDHKPEAIVALGPGCSAVVFDDDEKYKAQHRGTPGAGPEWNRNAAFVSYVKIPAP